MSTPSRFQPPDKAARAAVRRAKEEARGAEASFAYAADEYKRIRRLHEQGTASQQQLDQARVELERTRAKHRAATEGGAQAQGDLGAARGRLARTAPSPETLSDCVSIRAPADGRILRAHQTSAGVVQAGAPLVTVGNPDSLEVAVDVLSSDAVRMADGTPVEIVRWGGDQTLRGTVRVVEPMGRTKVSALGVEEQRVEVVADLQVPPTVQGRLGTGYAWSLALSRGPGTACSRCRRAPSSATTMGAVFVVRDGRARRQPVQVGQRSGLRVQITEGLSEGARVVTHPGDELSDGNRVEPR